MSDIWQGVSSRIEERGWKGRIVAIGHLAELEAAIRDRHEGGLLDETLFRDELSGFIFRPPDGVPDAKSIIIIAVPVPQTRILLNWKGARFPVVVPPTYAGYSTTTERAVAVLASWLETDGFKGGGSKLPLKTLAVRSGLAEYGRNNICYVPGMGSFLELVGLFSDLPCGTDSWREPKTLDRCATCVACLRHCPTAAITRDRFLLHAEACLTYHNESARDFPAWIDASWHHCLVGCMRCQSVCPENHAVRSWFDDLVEFSEYETGCLVDGVPPDQLPDGTAAKLASLQLNLDYRSLCRNLSMILSLPRNLTRTRLAQFAAPVDLKECRKPD